jgi:RES domain-containing protein
MRVFRLCKQLYSGTVLTGEGGLVVDGRWHSAGRRIVYAASSEALAVLEMRVHLGRFVPRAPYGMHVIEVPNELIKALSARALEKTWNAVPPTAHTQQIGDKWLRSNSTPALSVPSIHSATDRNVLLNPAHPAASGILLIRVDLYAFDHRLFNPTERPKPPERPKPRR